MRAEQQFLCDLAEKISMPEVYLKIRLLLEKPDARIRDYVAVLQTDSMLTVRIIRMANSRFFGFNRKAYDLYDAISLIGTIQLHDLLLSSLCMRTFCNIPDAVMDLKEFWLHGIECGIACRTLAKMAGLPAGHRFFALGLLLEIGHAAMFVKAPEQALDALLASREQGLPIDEQERLLFGFDYCQLGSELMRLWHLPEVYSHIIGHQLHPELTDPHYRNETYLVYLAQQVFAEPEQFNQALSGLKDSQQQFAAIPSNLKDLVSQEIANHLDDIFLMLCPQSVVQSNACPGGFPL
ncbi:HDOD domain-containing protein [Methylomonas sp. LW13]|uniref:HDOD domain-containing protein n=1 Tax=unclassified Methylomonas TaxID=2608980 RepID=UPI00051CA89B|nr:MULTISPECIES: HDOD domain-containing protein [unclassified Methylomonas]PKD38447.1 HDOD domain-containing protein [Methylomonas sp. Kb3]QBC28772.1 HDOD domain-containing protein [Methylomonas sp. LW13]